MKGWPAPEVARAAGAQLLGGGHGDTGPERVVIDSRQAGPGTLFVGLKGNHQDGGAYAGQALAAGAWGVLAAPQHLRPLAEHGVEAALLAGGDPLGALHRLATAWRRELGAAVIGVTGSTGKTSTKDLLLGLLAAHRRTVASRANFNTEIGLPVEILGAPAGTEAIVLEMAMRGAGQIAELTAIAEPDVGVIVNVGPVHLELLGSLEAIAAAKAELIAGLAAGATAVIPAGEPLLEPHVRDDVRTLRVGPSGDVRLVRARGSELEIDCAGTQVTLEVPFTQAHLRLNLLAAVAAAMSVGVTPSGRVELALSPGRGAPVELAGGVTLIDDSYNANPMSVRAALDYLVATAGAREDTASERPASDSATGLSGGRPVQGHRPTRSARRRVAVLGDMLELGGDERRFHTEIGEYLRERGLDVLVTVGPLAAEMARALNGDAHSVSNAAQAAALVVQLIQPGDVVLVKGSRGVGLELVCRTLTGARA